MQVAALLSDLKSLSACDHAAALSFVSAHRKSAVPPNPAPSQAETTTSPFSKTTTAAPPAKDPSPSGPNPPSTLSASSSPAEARENLDPDLNRALSLLSLHSQKVRWQEQMLNGSGNGGGGDPEPELTRLRVEVERIARERGE
ncbi:MAG: hypothetical protein Q9160_001709 [Pyrenula sp. 1 TL-2023]